MSRSPSSRVGLQALLLGTVVPCTLISAAAAAAVGAAAYRRGFIEGTASSSSSSSGSKDCRSKAQGGDETRAGEGGDAGGSGNASLAPASSVEEEGGGKRRWRECCPCGLTGARLTTIAPSGLPRYVSYVSWVYFRRLRGEVSVVSLYLSTLLLRAVPIYLSVADPVGA